MVFSKETGFMKGDGKVDPFVQFGSRADAARALYDPNHAGDITWAGAAIASDKGMVEPTRSIVSLLAGSQPVWEYRFAYVATSMRNDWAGGAPHASELLFVFDTVQKLQARKTPSPGGNPSRAFSESYRSTSWCGINSRSIARTVAFTRRSLPDRNPTAGISSRAASS
jgi:carboxylesterase type B